MKSTKTVKALYIFFALVGFALLGLLAVNVHQLNTSYSIRQFFPRNHPLLSQQEKTEKTFSLQGTPSFFVLLERKGPWLAPEAMKSLDAVTRKIEGWNDVAGVTSLANVEIAVNRKKEIRIGPLDEVLPAKEWEGFVRSQALFYPQLVSKDLQSVILAVEPKDTSSRGLQNLRQRLETSLRGDFKVSVAGIPAVQTRVAERVETEVGRFLGLSLLVFVVMFFSFYRNLSPVLFSALGLLACNGAVLGGLSFLGISFTVLLSTLPMINSIAFVSLMIHTLHLWADRLRDNGAPVDFAVRAALSRKVLKEIFMGNFLGALTTAIGFAMLAVAPIPAIQGYALTVAASVMVVFVVSQFLLLVFMPWMNPVQRKWTESRAWWSVKMLRFSAPLFVAIVGVSVFFGGAGFKLNFSSRLFDDLPKGDAIVRAMDRMDRDFGGTVPLDIGVTVKHDGAWSDPSALRELQKALVKIRSLEGVGSAIGLTDFMGERMPKTRAASSEVFFLFSMSPQDPLKHFVDASQQQTRVSVRFQDLPSKRIDALRAKVGAILWDHFPKAEIAESGVAASSHTINREVAKELVYGFWQALAVIGLLLVFVFRSVRYALVACLPNFIPPAFLIGALAFFQTPIKPAIALIFSIALGLAFNNTMYLLSRLKSLQSGRRGLPLRRALLMEGNPCLSESLLTFAGFFIFMSSNFQLNQTFGAYMVLSIFAGAIGDLVFLPVVLNLFPEILKKPETVSPLAPVEEASGLSRASGWILALLTSTVLVLAPAKTRAAEADDLLQKMRTNLETRSEQAEITMKIIEANGDQKVRKLALKTLRADGTFHALARLSQPADLKGTAFLAEVKNGEQSQWLYLPSSKQVRRVVTGKKNNGVLGSELSPADLSPEDLKGSKTTIEKKAKDSVSLRVDSASKDSEYTHAVIHIKLPESLPSRIDYFSGKTLKKTVQFGKFFSPDGKTHRPQKILVKNLENKRGTLVEISGSQLNLPLEAGDFTPASLKKSN